MRGPTKAYCVPNSPKHMTKFAIGVAMVYVSVNYLCSTIYSIKFVDVPE
jgi:hypothetical protein